ncbi:MAG: hypothetical protein V4580_13980 [Bacteroidota bacterium]
MNTINTIDMEKREFEELKLHADESISVLEKDGTVFYGRYRDHYDPEVLSFSFQEKKTNSETIIYIGEVSKIFRAAGL